VAKNAVIYLSFHEPHRLRLPVGDLSKAVSVPHLANSLMDGETTKYYFDRWLVEVCKPYALLLSSLADSGVKFLLNLSGPLLETMAQFRSQVPTAFVALLRHPNVELVCSDLKHSLSFYLDIATFERQMQRARELISEEFGVEPVLGMAPYMFMNSEIYYSLGKLNFVAALADGTQRLLAGRQAGYLRRNGEGPFLVTCSGDLNHQLVALTLGRRPSADYEVRTPQYVERVLQSAGEVVLLGWQVLPLNGHDEYNTGLALLEQLPSRLLAHDVRFISVTEVISRYGELASPLPLPALPAVSTEFGDLSFFFGHATQQHLFRLMHHAYSIAKLTRNDELVDLSLELAQWDILGLVHRLEVSNGKGSEPGYLTPSQWQNLGREGTISELLKVYESFVRCLSDFYL